MTSEDIDMASQAIEARDAIELYESDYYRDAVRWISEVQFILQKDATQSAEELRSSMFQYCNNNIDCVSEIQESASDLEDVISDAITKLELIQEIVNKVEEYKFLDKY